MSSENDTSNTSADAGNSHFTAAEVKFVLAALQHAEGGTLKVSLPSLPLHPSPKQHAS